MGPRLYWGGFFNLCTVLGTKQWDHGTKIILGRLFQFVHCTRYKVMGPWDQDYIGEGFSICTRYFVQRNGTMEPRLYRGGIFNLYTVLCIKQWDHGTKIILGRLFKFVYCIYGLITKQWDHGTKIILGRLFQFVHCTTYKAMGPWDQDYIGQTL
jgi:hypothetical protein